MASETKIEWCDATFNPWVGCTKISPACDHCYAAVSTPARALGVDWGARKPRHRTSVANWKLPLRWNPQMFYACGVCGWRGQATECKSVPHPDDQMPCIGCPRCSSTGLAQTPRRVFCASLADWLDNEVPAEWLTDLLSLIASTSNLDWLLLTKRIGNWHNRIAEAVGIFEQRAKVNGDCRGYALAWNWLHNGEPPVNVWIGATVCNQAEADRDVPKLLSVPAAVRYLSVEPMLGPVDLRWLITEPTGNTRTHHGKRQMELRSTGLLHWVIAGGESGTAARPSNPQWFRDIRDQCAAAGVAYLHKQNGEWVSVSEVEGVGEHYTFPDGRTVRRVGKRLAGRLLDGVQHDDYPEMRHA